MRPWVRAPRRARGADARFPSGPSPRRSAEACVHRGRARPRGSSRRRGRGATAPPPRGPSGTPRAGARGGTGRAPRGRWWRDPRPRGRAKASAWGGRARPRRARARARGGHRARRTSSRAMEPRSRRWTPARLLRKTRPPSRARRGFECARRSRASRGRVENTRGGEIRSTRRSTRRSRLGARGPICPVAMRCCPKTLLLRSHANQQFSVRIDRFSASRAFPRPRSPSERLSVFPEKRRRRFTRFGGPKCHNLHNYLVSTLRKSNLLSAACVFVAHAFRE